MAGSARRGGWQIERETERVAESASRSGWQRAREEAREGAREGAREEGREGAREEGAPVRWHAWLARLHGEGGRWRGQHGKANEGTRFEEFSADAEGTEIVEGI